MRPQHWEYNFFEKKEFNGKIWLEYEKSEAYHTRINFSLITTFLFVSGALSLLSTDYLTIFIPFGLSWSHCKNLRLRSLYPKCLPNEVQTVLIFLNYMEENLTNILHIAFNKLKFYASMNMFERKFPQTFVLANSRKIC